MSATRSCDWRERLGFDELRPGQAEAVAAVAAGRDNCDSVGYKTLSVELVVERGPLDTAS